jgi:ankyrin repeat protein
MQEQLTDSELQELEKAFSDLINYESDDPEQPIDPLTYREPGGDSCIHIASHRGNLRAVELLLKGGVDVNLKGEMDYTALHYANSKGHKDVVQYLLEHGASKDMKNKFGKLPLE